jgi:hypothetical protein
MTGRGEPFIVTGPHRLARLADVLITTTDRHPATDEIARLFRTYPGLTLVLITTATSTLRIGARDGTAVTVLVDQPLPATSPELRLLAGALYAEWIRGNRSSAHLGAQGGGSR